MLFYEAEQKNDRMFSWRKIASYFLLILGILSQEKAIIFPFLLIVTYVSFLNNGTFFNGLKKGFTKALPYLGIAATYFLLRLTILNFANTLNFYNIPTQYSKNLLMRISTFLRVLMTYYRLIFVPTGLHMDRSIELYSTLFSGFLPLLSLIFICALAYLLYFLQKNNKSNDFKIWLFGITWFFICLGPASGVIPINGILYEHWLYFALIGPAVIFVSYLVRIWGYAKIHKTAKYILAILLLSYGIFLGIQTIRMNMLWGNPIEFYKNILKYEPDSVRINNNLGTEYYNLKDYDNAFKYYQAAATEKSAVAQPFHNLAELYKMKGQTDLAIENYNNALGIDPNYYPSIEKLIEIYASKGNFTSALELLEKLKIIRPDDPEVYYNSALLYEFIGDKEKAIMDSTKAIDLSKETDSAVYKNAKDLLDRLIK
jgi:tetratricopeptide (TPR) repeat protein